MASRDPYSVLQLDHNASEDDIKKQYKKLALKYHPDKGGSLEQFQELNAAYEQLTAEEPPYDLKSFLNLFTSELFTGVMSIGPTISTHLSLTLEELQRGGQFNVTYTRRIPTGKMSQTSSSIGGFMNIISMMPEERTQLFETIITVPACHDERVPLTFPGHVSKMDKLPAGTLEVTLVIQTHKTFKRIPGTHHIETTLNISLRESLVGFERTITLLNGEDQHIQCTSIVNPYEVKEIPGMGLSDKGKLILRFHIQFPAILDQDTLDQLSTLLR